MGPGSFEKFPYPSSVYSPHGHQMLRTYAIGDIHGCLNKLQYLIKRCQRDAGKRPAKFVFLGDYIDRGPDSRGVIEFLVDLQSQQPDLTVCLAGNHEELALAALCAGQHEKWLRNGGNETLRSYGISSLADFPPHHIDWFNTLIDQHDDGRRLFVHAGINPLRPLDQQDDHDLRWMREPFLSDDHDYGRLIVHGHTPLQTDLPDQRHNRLNLDTGAVYGGPLTAAVFDDRSTTPLRFLQAF
jgi:serine/threonine protein phosphatase 1